MKSPFRFSQHGECGKWGSEIFPNIARHVDKMAFIHSCWTDVEQPFARPVHDQHGHVADGLPLRGLVGDLRLGQREQEPARLRHDVRHAGPRLAQRERLELGLRLFAEHLPGDRAQADGSADRQLVSAPRVSATASSGRSSICSKKLNQRHLEHSPDDSELAARIESFELAYRMQMAAPECLDLDKESKATQALYGLDNPRCTHFAKQCLIARRLVERGVRFVQIYSGGMENERSWDGHANIVKNHAGFAAEVDIPIAGLLTDLAFARPARFDARPLLRRIRPPADRAERRNRPRSQSARLHHLDGRRRRQGRRLVRRNATRSASRRP